MDRKTTTAPAAEPRPKKQTAAAWPAWTDWLRPTLGPAAEPIRRPARPARATAARRP